MKRVLIGVLFLGLFLFNAFLITMVQASVTLTTYDACWGQAFFYPLNEIITYDVPARNLVSPGPYPYVFTLSQPLHVYLQIRHFLWAYNENYTNHLTIRVDNESVLEAYSPRTKSPNDWYPGGDGEQIIDLGMRSAGTHYITMTCNISDYYAVDWWKILFIPQVAMHVQPV